MPRFRYPLAAVAAALLVAGCGSSSSSTSSSAGTTQSAAAPAATTAKPAPAPSGGASGAASALSLAADPGGALSFSTTSLHAKAGTVHVTFTNSAPEGHNLTIATPGGQLVGATPTFQGGSHSLAVHLKPGTYTFFCSVPGHRMAGMQGTLVVS